MNAKKNTKTKKSAMLLVLCLLFFNVPYRILAQADPQQVTKITFKGKISLDVCDSKEDWAPYTPKLAPNILFIL